jgi:hypothetical protein
MVVIIVTHAFKIKKKHEEKREETEDETRKTKRVRNFRKVTI